MISAMIYMMRAGAPWRDLPEEYGPWKSVYTRFRRWIASGLWARMFAEISREPCGRIRSIDCTHVKVHRDGSNAAGGRSLQAIGQTKGGLNTKVAAAVDGLGRVVAFHLAPGQTNDVKATAPFHHRLRNCWVAADRAFDTKPFRDLLTSMGAIPCIPPKANRKVRYDYSKTLYRHRHTVENFFCRIKFNRRIATRYDKLAATFSAFLTLASIIDWLSFEV